LFFLVERKKGDPRITLAEQGLESEEKEREGDPFPFERERKKRDRYSGDLVGKPHLRKKGGAPVFWPEKGTAGICGT